MTFGVNMNHLSSGLEQGYIFPSNLQIDPKKATPIIYNVIDAATIVNLLNILLLPKPKIFVGYINFIITPVNDSRVIYLYDPMGNPTFTYSDSVPINGRNEKYINSPMHFTKIESTLTAKYSLAIYGYLFEYHF